MDNLRRFVAVCACILIVVMTYQFVQIHELIEQTKTEIREVHDTIEKVSVETLFVASPIVYKVDTLKVHTEAVWSPQIEDSVQVELPYISKEFKDSLYEAWVSGYYDVNLDSIRIFKEKQIIEINNQVTQYKYKNRPFSLGVQTGVQYNFITKRPEPYIGLGISYNIINFGKR